MIQFCEAFPDVRIVATLSRQLNWSQFVCLIPLQIEESRLFYAHACAESRWSVRELRQAIERKTYERTAIAANETTGIATALAEVNATGETTPGLVFFWTELPPREELERRLHAALAETRERLRRRGLLES